MATANPLKILEVCRVTPLIDSLDSMVELSFALTHFDILCLKFHPVETIFFYEFTDSTLPVFNSVIVPKLKSSLSLTLLNFLHVAGKIIWPPHATKPFILYTPDDDVSVTIAESHADFTQISSNQMNEAVESRFYIPELPVSDSKAATIAFQITLFPNQGFSIGISSHHALFDGKSLTMFIKAWAHICKQSEIKKSLTLPPELTPFFSQTIVQDLEGLDMIYANNWLEAKLPGFNVNSKSLKLLPTLRSQSNLTRATFELSCNDIKKLRQKVISELDNPNQIKSMHLSTFVLSYAYTFVCIVKAKKLERKRKVGIAFSVDCRARLDPPLPANYFGNCVTGCRIFVEAEDLFKENGINFVVKRLSDMINRLQKGVLKEAKEKLANYLKVMEQGESEVVGVAFSPKFEIYKTDFGWGRPKKVDVISLDRNGAIFMAESRHGGDGIEVGVVLKKHEMEIFNSLFHNGLLDL